MYTVPNFTLFYVIKTEKETHIGDHHAVQTYKYNTWAHKRGSGYRE
jgi:hypothetical protein